MDAGIEMEIDRKVAHGGSASVRFRKTRVSFNPIRYLAQAVTRDSEQRRIEVGVWVKAENARKACVAIGFEADGTGTVAWGAYVGEAKEGDKPANHGWRRYTSVLAIPPGTESLNVMLQMYGPGTVWLDDVTVRYVPASTPLREAASEEDGGEDVKDVPNLDLRAGNDPMKRYFLIGKPIEGANKLLVVLPGGDGSAENNLFVRRVWKNALPPGYLIAELVAPKWSDGQMDSITWPTRKVRWAGMKFATEDFVEAVVKDASTKAKIDPAKVFTLSWSSGGPAAYATSLANGPVKGSLIAMSVYYPQQLPPTINAGGHAYYLLHSPDDFIPMKLPEQAKKELTAAGAKVTLATYRGGHGWTEDPFGNIRKGVEWLEANGR
jgi:predicted esterase